VVHTSDIVLARMIAAAEGLLVELGKTTFAERDAEEEEEGPPSQCERTGHIFAEWSPGIEAEEKHFCVR
jgi:hypothetical protein